MKQIASWTRRYIRNSRLAKCHWIIKSIITQQSISILLFNNSIINASETKILCSLNDRFCLLNGEQRWFGHCFAVSFLVSDELASTAFVGVKVGKTRYDAMSFGTFAPFENDTGNCWTNRIHISNHTFLDRVYMQISYADRVRSGATRTFRVMTHSFFSIFFNFWSILFAFVTSF